MKTLIGLDVRKYDFASDTFRGISELNNYELVLLGEDKVNIDKYYYINDNIFSLCSKRNTIYDYAEVINIGYKYALLLNYKNVSIKIQNNNMTLNDYNLLLETLDSIEIPYNIDASLKGNEDVLFQVVSDNNVIVSGYIKDECVLNIDFLNIVNSIDEKYIKSNSVDISVVPESNNNNSDALIIATMVRDAGYKVEVNYSNNSNIECSYMIKINSKTEKNYTVILKDMKTMEEKEVSINNLVEELDISF